LRKIRSEGKQRKKPEQKKQELRDFIAKKIEQLIQEQEDKSKQQKD
jgi:hypothetical protein